MKLEKYAVLEALDQWSPDSRRRTVPDLRIWEGAQVFVYLTDKVQRCQLRIGVRHHDVWSSRFYPDASKFTTDALYELDKAIIAKQPYEYRQALDLFIETVCV